jgi:hypothetical protein
MLGGWGMLWNIGLMELLAAVALGIGVVAMVEVVASIRCDGR